MDGERKTRASVLRPDDLGIVEAVDGLVRSWKLILGGAAAAGLVTCLVILIAGPMRWQSTAMLVVSPPGFSSELRPPAFSLQGYQKLLESDAVIAETRRRLIEQGVVDADASLRSGRELKTQIFVSRKAEETTLSPMVLAIAYGRTARQAASIANTWVEVFLATTRDVALGATSPTIEFIDTEYASAYTELAKAEAERTSAVERFAELNDRAVDRWDGEISKASEVNGAALAGYRAETQRLVEENTADHSLETREVQLYALRSSLADLQVQQSHVSAEREQKQLQLEAARARLERTPQLIQTRKAMSDDAMWAAAAQKETKTDWAAIGGRTLFAEEMNPVYADLSGEVARLEIELNALVPRAAQLTSQLGELAAAIRDREVDLARDRAGVATTRENRDAGLFALLGRQATGMAAHVRARDRELAKIKHEQDDTLNSLDRTVAARRDLFASLSKVHNQALLARAQPISEDVRLAAPAVPPHEPESKGLPFKTGVGTVLGGLAGVLFAIAREARARARTFAQDEQST
jgi:hypothetical protein